MKILFTTPELRHPASGGPVLRIENSIKALNKISELHVISRVPKFRIGGDNAENFYKKHCFNFTYTPRCYKNFNNLAIKLVSKLIRDLIKQEVDFFINQDADFIINYVKKNNIDLVWFGYGNISFSLMKQIKTKNPEIKIVCDTDSVWSRFVLRELPYETDPKRIEYITKSGKQKEKEEADWVNFCDVTTAVSEVDAEYYRSLAKEPERVRIFSNVIDLETYSNKHSPPAGFKKPAIYLAGSFSPKSSMDKAARWVINDVLPLVQSKIPDIHFYIVGKDSDITLQDINNPNITITGILDSVLPYLCNVDVSLVPLKFESGTRFKILEAGACGIPIVSTTLGAEGINVTDNENILIADEPEIFANAIIKLIDDKDFAKRISENCKKFIEKHYGITNLVNEAEEIIRYLSNK